MQGMPLTVLELFQGQGSVNERLSTLHTRILLTMPAVDRIACVLYDQQTDLLKTFVNSTRQGIAIEGYQAKLADSHELKILADSGRCRVIDAIAENVRPGSIH